jgi:transcriptional regulator with XRE-family HTH domain
LKNRKLFIGRVIFKLRMARGLSQEELAFRANITRKAMYNIETGKQSPTLETFMKIADALEMKSSEIMAEIEKSLKHP